MEKELLFIIFLLIAGAVVANAGFITLLFSEISKYDDFNSEIELKKIDFWPEGELKSKALFYIKHGQYEPLKKILKHPPGSTVNAKSGTRYLIDKDGKWLRVR